jgi:hypothetical protein
MIKLNKLKFLLLAGLFTLSLIAPVSRQKDALAANGSDFNSGNIIDDATFWNKNAMSVQEIQSFLNSKVPSCDTWGQKNVRQSNQSTVWGIYWKPCAVYLLEGLYRKPRYKSQ